VGFNEVYPYPAVYEGKYILSHAMVDMFKGSRFINIHGHIHNRESGIPNCVNVSVEMTGYTPVLLEDVVSGCGVTASRSLSSEQNNHEGEI
jgi:calcineurin-like phosphoesterase family protein